MTQTTTESTGATQRLPQGITQGMTQGMTQGARIHSSHERPRYRRIGEYGAIGDCRTAALVAPDGSIDWCCMPHFDSPAVLLRLLDADKGGYFQVCPAHSFTSAMSYLPWTNVLETLFHSSRGQVRLVDCMPIRHRERPTSQLEHLTQTLAGRDNVLRAGLEREIGNDVAAAHRITRIATCLEGAVDLDITLKATFDYARGTASIQVEQLGPDAAGAILTAGKRYLVLIVRFLPTQAPDGGSRHVTIGHEDGMLHARVTIHSGERITASLNYARNEHEARRLLDHLRTHDFDADLDETIGYWHDWIAHCRYDGIYQQEVIRSALALKLCTFEPTGAIVAAPTTSLPEHIGGVRNWDYRYTWLRDSAFTLDALGQLGYYDEARDYFHFLHDLNVDNIDNLHILYGIRGEDGAQLAEHDLPHLEGYRGSRPVRVGNQAATQCQLDIFGEILDSAYSYVTQSGYRHGKRSVEPDRSLRDLAFAVADYVQNHWRDKDNGIWEIRGTVRDYVYSKVMCWVALDRACMMAGKHGHEHCVDQWQSARDAIHQQVLTQGYDAEVGSFLQAYGTYALDSANLRIPLVHFLPARDPKMASTIEVMGRRLAGPQDILYRYGPATSRKGQPEEPQTSIDRLPGSEGAFLACTFWLVSDLCHLGKIEEARRRFERLLRYASPLGLYSEEVDPGSGDLLGNYPQAFTHIALVNSAVTLQRAQEGRLGQNGNGHTRG